MISTPKRPVPLQHFLYTGNSNKTSNELFMIVDADGKFLTRGYEAAVAAKKAREGKGKDAYGSKTHQTTNIKEVCSQILENILMIPLHNSILL